MDPEQKKQLNGLANYSWPGNIRELDSIIRTYLALRSDLEFDEEEFTKVFLSRRQLPVKSAFIENLVASASVSSLKEQISAYEAKISANNRTEAAKRLEISVNSLWRKSRRQQLDS